VTPSGATCARTTTSFRTARVLVAAQGTAAPRGETTTRATCRTTQRRFDAVCAICCLPHAGGARGTCSHTETCTLPDNARVVTLGLAALSAWSATHARSGLPLTRPHQMRCEPPRQLRLPSMSSSLSRRLVGMGGLGRVLPAKSPLPNTRPTGSSAGGRVARCFTGRVGRGCQRLLCCRQRDADRVWEPRVCQSPTLG
jgi:hypothetical protein